MDRKKRKRNPRTVKRLFGTNGKARRSEVGSVAKALPPDTHLSELLLRELRASPRCPEAVGCAKASGRFPGSAHAAWDQP